MQKKSWRLLLSLLPFSGLLAAFFAFTPYKVHAAINTQTGACACDGGPLDYGCLLQIFQNVINTGVALIIVFIVLLLVYVGFSFMTSGANPGSREQARTMLTNAFVGLLVVLSSWLIVDFVMKTLYSGGSGFGPWNSILAPKGDGSDFCIKENKSQGKLSVGEILNPGTENSSSGGGSCTAIPDSQLVTVDGYRLTKNTAQQYQAMKAAASKDGISLIISSGYRSPDDQLRAWKNNGCNLVGGKTVCATRTAAVPCSLGGGGSNHTRGTAVDIRLNPGVYAWLTKNASRFGFYNKLPKDLPHWSDTGN
jgi:D-alanyl-D-alanine carboxypeptidase/Type IV secretion system pilin